MKHVFALIICGFLLPPVSRADADNGKMNSSLSFLKNMRSKTALRSNARGIVKSGIESDRAVVTVKFDHILSPAEISEYESRGVSFYYLSGEIAKTGAIYPVKIPWSELDSVSGKKEVLRMESSWHPAIYPTLDVSAKEIEADSAWGYNDDSGFPITGKGIRIADFDTGIDVFHPSFFYADGDTFNWLDVNLNGRFDCGDDAVDLNNNGGVDGNERLCCFDGEIADYAHVWGATNPSNSGNGFQAYWDWLYNDENANSIRDYGTASGFDDSDPTFGEQIFLVLDTNKNGDLDEEEQLVGLKTSKIYATMNSSSTERIRGVDLIQSDPDDYGHGTGVSGILAGGTPGLNKFTGVAPGAEILMGYYFSDNPLSYLIPWARSKGADVMLYEFGGFVWEYLDGSSLGEQLITDESDSIFQVVPSGNLGRGGKHAIADAAGSDSVEFQIDAAIYGTTALDQLYGTTLWRTELSDLIFRLESPLGGEITISGGDQYVDGYYIWSSTGQSDRGTCRQDIYVDRNTNADVLGDWYLTVSNQTGSTIEVISNIADNVSSWSGGAVFANYATDERNVTYPATADSAFVNGSYSTRGFEGYGGVGGGTIDEGEISAFSGRGARIDGMHLLDICSPGNYDVYSTKSHTDSDGYPLGGYMQFSGTSAAGPHVAAAAALVQQKHPGKSMDEIAGLIQANAASDGYTGSVYNDTWGYGKLRIIGALGVVTGIEDVAGGKTPPVLTLGQNYPNPFNPSTHIPFYIPKTARAGIRIYDVKGRLVRNLEDGLMPKGPHTARWNGIDNKGKQVSSGIYFCVLRQGENMQSRKMVLLR